MHWELWDAISRNQLAAYETEAGALAGVRDLVDEGWKAAELLLIVDDRALADEEVPPAVSGDELVRRARAAHEPTARRMA